MATVEVESSVVLRMTEEEATILGSTLGELDDTSDGPNAALDAIHQSLMDAGYSEPDLIELFDNGENIEVGWDNGQCRVQTP